MNSKKLNKALSVGLCAAVLVPGIVSAKEFKDVKANGEYGWAYKYIDVLSDDGVIDGYPNGNYEPAKPVSLEETFQLLKGIINPSSSELKDAVKNYGSICDENGVSSWAKDSVSLALSRGIVSSTDLKQAKDKDLLGPNKTKYPDRNTVSVYFAKGLNLSANGNEKLLKHKDVDKIPAVTKGYLASLVEAGIFDATGSDGVFEGNRHIRRSEMAKITKLSYDHAKATGLDLEEKTIDGKVILATNLNNIDTIITEKDSKRSQFRVDSNTVYKQNGKNVSFKDIKPEQEVKITYVKNGDDTVTGLAKTIEIVNSEKKLVGYVTDSNKDNFTVKYRTYDEKEVDYSKDKTIKTTDNAKFKLAKDAKIYKYGKKIDVSDLKVDDLIEFKTDASGDVKEAYVFPKKGEVKGRVTNIDNGSSTRKASITLKLDDDNKYVFYAKDNNDDDNPFYKTNFFDGVKEDKDVTLQLNYKIVTKIGESSSNEDFAVGKISRVELYDKTDRDDRIGYIRIDTNDEEDLKYYLTEDTKIKKGNTILTQVKAKDLKGEYVRVDLDGRDIETLTKLDKDSFVDAAAQITDISTDWKYGEKEYKIKILDSKYSNLKYGDTYTFSSDEGFDRWEVVRITGEKSGGSLDNIRIERIEKPGKEYSSNYGFDFGRGKSKNGSGTKIY